MNCKLAVYQGIVDIDNKLDIKKYSPLNLSIHYRLVLGNILVKTQIFLKRIDNDALRVVTYNTALPLLNFRPENIGEEVLAITKKVSVKLIQNMCYLTFIQKTGKKLVEFNLSDFEEIKDYQDIYIFDESIEIPENPFYNTTSKPPIFETIEY